MAVIRNRREAHFTVVPNDVMRRPDLSLQAKGLLALMLSYPDDWRYNLNHLLGLSKNGRDAHRAALRELEDAGYARWQTIHDGDGTLQGRELVVSDAPMLEDAGAGDTNRGPTILADEEDVEEEASRRSDIKVQDPGRVPEKPSDGGPTVRLTSRPSGTPTVGKPEATNTDLQEEPDHEEHPPRPLEPTRRARVRGDEEGEEKVHDLKGPDALDDLTHHQRRQATKPPDALAGSRLATFHPSVWKALIELKRNHGNVNAGTFTTWAERVAEDVEKHGEDAVAAALGIVSENMPSVKHAMPFYRACLRREIAAAKADPGDQELRPLMSQEELDEMFRLAKEGALT